MKKLGNEIFNIKRKDKKHKVKLERINRIGTKKNPVYSIDFTVDSTTYNKGLLIGAKNKVELKEIMKKRALEKIKIIEKRKKKNG